MIEKPGLTRSESARVHLRCPVHRVVSLVVVKFKVQHKSAENKTSQKLPNPLGSIFAKHQLSSSLVSPQCSVARSLPAIPRCSLEPDLTLKIWAKNSKIDSCCLHPKGLDGEWKTCDELRTSSNQSTFYWLHCHTYRLNGKVREKHLLSLQKCDIWNEPQRLAKSQTSLMAPGNSTRVWKKEKRKSVAHVDSKTSAISQVLVAVLDGSGWYSFCLICLTDFSTPGLISSSSSSTHCTVALLQDLPQFMFVKKTSEIRENQTSQTLSNHHSCLQLSWSAAGPLPTIGADRPLTKSTA